MILFVLNLEDRDNLKFRIKMLALKKNVSAGKLGTEILLDAVKKMEAEEKK